MIRVMIVEDEPLAQRIVSNAIEYTNPDFKVVAHAYDGEEALRILDSVAVNLIVTDIRMPVMDGLLMLEQLTEEGRQIPAVILSGYADFEYARRAIGLGVVDYLLKPINYEQLGNLLENIKQYLGESNLQRQTEVLREIIARSEDIASYSDSDAHHLFNYDFYTCILLCAGSLCSTHQSYVTPARDLWIRNNIACIVTETLDCCKFWMIEGKYFNERLLIVASSYSQSEIQHKIRSLFNAICKSADVPVTMVVSMEFTDIFDLVYHDNILRLNLEKRLRFGLSTLLFEKDYANPTSDCSHPISNLGNLDDGLRGLCTQKHFQAFIYELNAMIRTLQQNQCTQMQLSLLIRNAIHAFFRQNDLMTEAELLNKYMETDELVCDNVDFESILSGVYDLFGELFHRTCTNSGDQETASSLMNKVEKFISAHFTENISLLSLGEIFGYSPRYIGRLYKKTKGLSPAEQITQLRLERACKLIKDNNNMPLQEVARIVGYEDPLYFSRVFKAHYGVSPREYQRMPS